MPPVNLKHCPVCGKLAVEKFRPFCSARCADVDLGRWFGESYKVAAKETDEPAMPAVNASDEQPEN